MEMLRTGRIILPVFDCAIKGILVYSVHGGVYNLRCKLAVVEWKSGNYQGHYCERK